jgi:xylulokinase
MWLISLSPLRGPALRWFRDSFLPAGAAYADIDNMAAHAPPGAGGLLWLPYLSGEKGVIHDPDARGSLVGLDAQHQPRHIARALLEGIAFGIREILEAYEKGGVPIEEVRLSGGGARSRLWNQIKADVLGQTVGVLQALETGCLAAAVLAAVATGQYHDRREASLAMARVSEVVQPNPTCVEIYQQAYCLYK